MLEGSANALRVIIWLLRSAASLVGNIAIIVPPPANAPAAHSDTPYLQVPAWSAWPTATTATPPTSSNASTAQKDSTSITTNVSDA